MKKLLVFVGDAGSGKTTLIAELVKRYPDKFKKVVTCTSRPPRIGEIDGVDYRFMDIGYFNSNQDLVLEKRTDGGDCYGTRKSDLYSDTHCLLLTLRFAGISQLDKLGIGDVAIVQMSIDEDLKIMRMRMRGDTEKMIRSRIDIDSRDRANNVWGRIPVTYLDAKETLEEKVRRIIEAY